MIWPRPPYEMRASARRSWRTVLSLAISWGRITPLTCSSRNSALTRTSCQAATAKFPFGSNWVMIQASRSVTLSLRLMLAAPALVLLLLVEISLAGSTDFGKLQGRLLSNPRKLGMPTLSAPARV